MSSSSPRVTQVVRRHILGSIVQSERSYVDSLRRILQVRNCLVSPLADAAFGPPAALGGPASPSPATIMPFRIRLVWNPGRKMHFGKKSVTPCKKYIKPFQNVAFWPLHQHLFQNKRTTIVRGETSSSVAFTCIMLTRAWNIVYINR